MRIVVAPMMAAEKRVVAQMTDAPQGTPAPTPTPPGWLARLADALALAPLDADDSALLERVPQALASHATCVVALLTRDDAGAVQIAAVAPARSDPARALVAAIARQPSTLGAYAGLFDQPTARAAPPTGVVVASCGPSETANHPDGGTMPLAPVSHADAPQALWRAAGLKAGDAVVVPSLAGGAPDNLLAFGWATAQEERNGVTAEDITVCAALLGAARAVRAGLRREAMLRAQAEASVVAGRELAHRLNNDLTMPVGVVELLLDRSTFTPDLREMLAAAAHDLAKLEQHIRDFHQAMRAQSDAVEAAGHAEGRQPDRL